MHRGYPIFDTICNIQLARLCKARPSAESDYVSFFDRLKSTLTGSEAAPALAPAPLAKDAPASVTESADTSFPSKKKSESRFMGRDNESLVPMQAQSAATLSSYWVFICANTQRLVMVPEMGSAEGEPLSYDQIDEMRSVGISEEVAYQAGYDQYWKMPSQESILRMPKVYGVEIPLLNRMKLTTKLVKGSEPRGFWMHIRLRTPDEMAALQVEEPRIV